MSYDNTNSGALFKNKDKIEHGKPNWADYQGSINIEGVEYWISAWIKKPKKGGDTFMSLSVNQKEGQQQAPAKQQAVPSSNPPIDDFSDDIPF